MTTTRIIISFLILTIISCRHEALIIPEETPGQTGGTDTVSTGGINTCSPDTVYFRQQVLPILVSNCTKSGCHDERSRRDGVVLTSYTTVMNTGGIRAGNPSRSELYEVIMEDDDDDRMPRPPAPPLSAEQKNIIYKWIQQGAKDLSCENACDVSSPVTYARVIKPILAANCTGCHGAASPAAGIDLSNYNVAKQKVNDGRLWGTVKHLAGYSPMPKNGEKLSDCELDQIQKWIAAGSPNN